MARLLYEADSTPFCVRTAMRHIHLCNQNKGCDTFAVKILPFGNTLRDKRKLTEDAEEKCSFALDLIYLREAELDDTVRSDFSKCKDYDREHVGENTLKVVFPNETFSDFVRLPYPDKPAVARQIKQRLEHLGNTHTLYALAVPFEDRIAALELSITADKTAKDALKAAAGAEAIARTDLRHAYEANYLDGRKLLGSKLVERIFPVINHRPDDEDGTNGTTGSNS